MECAAECDVGEDAGEGKVVCRTGDAGKSKSVGGREKAEDGGEDVRGEGEQRHGGSVGEGKQSRVRGDGESL